MWNLHVHLHRASSYALQSKVQSDRLTPLLSMRPQLGEKQGDRVDILLALNALRFSMALLQGQSAADNRLVMFNDRPLPYARVSKTQKKKEEESESDSGHAFGAMQALGRLKQLLCYHSNHASGS